MVSFVKVSLECKTKVKLFTKHAAAAKSLQSCPTLCNPIDGSHQAPPSLGFSRQEHWSGLPFPSLGDLPDPGMNPGLLHCRQILYQLKHSVQFSSVAQSCPTLCDPMNCSTPGLPVHHQLPEFTETHIHRVSDAIQPSHPLSSPSPSAPNPSQHQSSSESAYHIRWPKY